MSTVKRSLFNSQNALSTVAEKVLSTRAGRTFAEIKNMDAAITVYLGKDNTVSSANGYVLKAGEAFSLDNFVGEVWAIAASGTPTVCILEW